MVREGVVNDLVGAGDNSTNKSSMHLDMVTNADGSDFDGAMVDDL